MSFQKLLAFQVGKISNFFDNKYVQKIIIGLFFTVLFVAFLYGMTPHENLGVDYSWFWALNNLIYRHDLIPGADYNFTYGPLGFILVPLNYGYNLYITIFSSVLCSLLITGILFFNYKTKQISAKNIIKMMILFFIFVIPTADWIWALCVFVLSVGILKLKIDSKADMILVSALSCFSGVLSAFCLLLKMNLAICAFLTFFVLALMILFESKKKFFNYLIFSVLSFGAIFLLEIKILFLNIHNFKTWFLTSLEIAKGFSYAMSVEGHWFYLVAAIVIIGLYIYLAIFTFKKDRDVFNLFVLGFPLLFFVYKHGFTRQDTHMFSFYSTIFYLVGFIYLFSKGEVAGKIFKAFLVMTVLSFIFLFTYNEIKPQSSIGVAFNNSFNLLNIDENIEKNLKERENLYKSLILPEDWTKEIGDSSIEVLPYELVYIQANKMLNWRPNPILQLYSVYTNKLDKISANSFTSIQKPHLILLEFASIDNRNMFLDTPQTFNAILSSYEIVKSDKDKILLKYKKYKDVNLRLKSFGTYNSGDLIKLPEGSGDLYAKIYIEPTFIGNVFSFLFRGDEVFVDINYKTADNKTYKIVPDTLRAPFEIRYIPQDMCELKSIIENKPDTKSKVESIIFRTGKFCYNKSIKIEWYQKY